MTLLTHELKPESRASSRRRTVAATSLKAEEEGIAFAEQLFFASELRARTEPPYVAPRPSKNG
jgi:hypothetical protein